MERQTAAIRDLIGFGVHFGPYINSLTGRIDKARAPRSMYVTLRYVMPTGWVGIDIGSLSTNDGDEEKEEEKGTAATRHRCVCVSVRLSVTNELHPDMGDEPNKARNIVCWRLVERRWSLVFVVTTSFPTGNNRGGANMQITGVITYVLHATLIKSQHVICDVNQYT